MPLVITLSSGEARVVLGNAALLDIIGERLGPDMKEAVEAALIREREEGKEASWDELEDKEDRLAQILLLAECCLPGDQGGRHEETGGPEGAGQDQGDRQGGLEMYGYCQNCGNWGPLPQTPHRGRAGQAPGVRD